MPRTLRALSPFSLLLTAVSLLEPRACAQDGPPAPSAQQQSLLRLVGDWDVEATIFDQGKPIGKLQMQEHIESVCGGLFVLSRLDAEMSGQKIQRYAFTGWNATTNHIEGIEVDSMGGSHATTLGDVNLTTGGITWKLTSQTPQGPASTESTLTFDGPDARTEWIHAKAKDGERVPQTKLRSTRRKAGKDTPSTAANAAANPVKPASPAHEKLLAFVGDWNVTTKMSLPGVPDSPTGQMKSNEQLVCLGRFVLTRVDGEFGGMEFHGIGLTGYDDQKKRYISFWGDSFGAYLMTTEGNYGEDGTTLTMSGNSVGPDGKPNTTTETTQFEGKDKRKSVMVSRDQDGKEVSTMTLECVRMK